MVQALKAGEKLRVAVHKFSSCDGCQLSLLNLGERLIELSEWLEFVHFAEMGSVAPDALVDVAFVEGSISTPEELQRIQGVRQNAKKLITIGACATAGGIQALRNRQDGQAWFTELYPQASEFEILPASTPVAEHVRVDFELWGCPINRRQILAVLDNLRLGVQTNVVGDKVCMECKRQQVVCVMVTRDIPCMGPVTQTGCGALCPAFGRDCYACYGPAENSNTHALSARLHGFGLSHEAIGRRFSFINNQAPVFREAADAPLVADENNDG